MNTSRLMTAECQRNMCRPKLVEMFPRFYVCEICGNKRCPHIEWHGYECTHSNATGQIGTVRRGYEHRA